MYFKLFSNILTSLNLHIPAGINTFFFFRKSGVTFHVNNLQKKGIRMKCLLEIIMKCQISLFCENKKK